MMDDKQMPERIWASREETELLQPEEGFNPVDQGMAEYVRSDLCASAGYTALVEELRRDPRDWNNTDEADAYNDALDDVLTVLASREATPARQASCRKCGGTMQLCHAIAQTYTSGAPDDLGATDGQTMSAGGPGVLIDCRKCEDCGWSVTADPQPEAATPTAQEPEAIRYSFDGDGWLYADRGNGGDWLERALDYPDAEPLYTAITLYAHPPQPSETVAEAIASKLACTIDDIDDLALFLRSWGLKSKNSRNAGRLMFAADVIAALRALKGGEA